MTYEQYKEAVDKKVREDLDGLPESKIAKIMSDERYDIDMRHMYKCDVSNRETQGAGMTDEAYWRASINTAADNLTF